MNSTIIFTVSGLLSIPLFLPSIQETAPTPNALDGGPVAARGEAVQFQWNDWNGDGRADALVITSEGRLRLLANEASGSLVDVTRQAGLESISEARFGLFEDFSGDGRTDLFIGTTSGPCHLLQQTEHGSFEDITALSGISASNFDRSAHWLDYDRDGLLDLHLVGECENTLYRAVAPGVFEALPLIELAPSPFVGGGTALNPGTGSATRANAAEVGAATRGSTSSAGGTRATIGGPVPTGTAAAGNPTDVFNCVNSLLDAGSGGCLQASSSATLGMLYPLSNKFFVDEATGRIGMGTIAPSSPLHLASNVSWPMRIEGNNQPGININNTSTASSWAIYQDSGDSLVFRDSTTGANTLAISGSSLDVGVIYDLGVGTTTPERRLHVKNGDAGVDPTTNSSLVVESNGESSISIIAPATFEASVFLGNSDAGANAAAMVFNPWSGPEDGLVFRTADTNRIVIDNTGRVGIGSDISPQGSLSVTGVSGTSDPSEQGVHMGIIPYTTNDDTGITIVADTGGGSQLRFSEVGAGSSYRLWRPTGSSELKFDGGGLAKVSVPTLEIRGGADIVEGFETSDAERLEPGTVVVIDPRNAGALMRSTSAYDFKVAGVVSGAGGVQPGLHLGQESVMDGDTQVAMTGRVYVKCSAENGSIQPGDRLTTAALAGHAMKATDAAKSDGAVIGKAMSSLDEGTGLVLVLVNLQ